VHWKVKSKIQNILALFPKSISYVFYYWVQRNFGNLRNPNPTKRMKFAIESWKHIQNTGQNPIGKVFFETGTGRMPVVPLSYWLMGAEKTITIDLNPYLKKELIIDCLEYISKNKDAIMNLFGPLIVQERMDRLIKKRPFSINEFLNLCDIDYIAPGDASNTKLSNNFIDYHISTTVFEHIPKDILKKILEEGNRIIKKNGLFIHRIDYTDHFSHSDRTISEINFLQYSRSEWEKLAGNRYMYMNRLRHDDYLRLFKSVGQSVIDTKVYENKYLNKLLNDKHFKLNDDFILKSNNVLSITGAWIVSKKK
jgi:hypothetical protein